MPRRSGCCLREQGRCCRARVVGSGGILRHHGGDNRAIHQHADLVREPGRAFSRSELLDRAFGYDYEGVERTVDVHIMNLRRKIEPGGGEWRFITTVPGLGYRFESRNVA